MSDIITVRDLAMVTSDIQYAQRQGARQLVSNLIEIGRLLLEAKTMVQPKDWEKYIWDNFGYSTSSADNWMKLYKEYGDDQESLFDSFRDSQTFGKLSYTQLLALTALPAEERSSFVAENDVENMSTRQLQQAIKERDEARRKLAESEEKLVDAEGDLDDARFDLEKARNRNQEIEAENKELRAKADKAAKAHLMAEEDLKKVKKQLSAAEAEAKKAKEEAKKATQNPEIPEAVMEQMRRELEAEAAQKAAADLQKELDEAQARADSADKALKEAQQKLQEQQKASAMSNPDVAVFKTLLQQVRDDFNRLQGARMKIQTVDADMGANLRTVMLQLLDKLREEVSA